MLKRVIFIVGLIAVILTVSLLWTYKLGSFIGRSTYWIYIAAFAGSITAGIIAGIIKRIRRLNRINTAPHRHLIDSIMEHWGTAVGILILIISGYRIHTGGGLNAIKLHFLGLFLTLLFGGYFLSDFIVSKKYSALFPGIKDIIDGTIKKYLLRVNVKETGKYLASQKSSFLLFVILGGLIFISGLIKLIRFYVSVPFQMLNVATSIHDISAIIFGILLAVHILLVIVRRSNWPLLKSWLDGKTPQ